MCFLSVARRMFLKIAWPLGGFVVSPWLPFASVFSGNPTEQGSKPSVTAIARGWS